MSRGVESGVTATLLILFGLSPPCFHPTHDHADHDEHGVPLQVGGREGAGRAGGVATAWTALAPRRCMQGIRDLLQPRLGHRAGSPARRTCNRTRHSGTGRRWSAGVGGWGGEVGGWHRQAVRALHRHAALQATRQHPKVPHQLSGEVVGDHHLAAAQLVGDEGVRHPGGGGDVPGPAPPPPHLVAWQHKACGDTRGRAEVRLSTSCWLRARLLLPSGCRPSGQLARRSCSTTVSAWTHP